jgi:hypothetical protein
LYHFIKMLRPHPVANLILPSGGVLYQERLWTETRSLNPEELAAHTARTTSLSKDSTEPALVPAYSSVITLNRNQRRRKLIKAEKAARMARAAARALANATPDSSQN